MINESDHDNHHSQESGHGSVKSYFVGFVLSIALTVIAFAAVYQAWFNPLWIIVLVSGCALIQLLVQLMLFLHLSSESTPYWNLSALLFSTLIVMVVVAGSIWIMHNLDMNMM